MSGPDQSACCSCVLPLALWDGEILVTRKVMAADSSRMLAMYSKSPPIPRSVPIRPIE